MKPALPSTPALREPAALAAPVSLYGLAVVLDVAFTLIGQPALYWQGDLGAARELNALFLPLLCSGPVSFVVVALIACAGVALLTALLPRGIALALLFLSTIAHGVGAAGWAFATFGVGMGLPLAIVLLLVLRGMSDRSWGHASDRAAA